MHVCNHVGQVLLKVDKPVFKLIVRGVAKAVVVVIVAFLCRLRVGRLSPMPLIVVLVIALGVTLPLPRGLCGSNQLANFTVVTRDLVRQLVDLPRSGKTSISPV